MTTKYEFSSLKNVSNVIIKYWPEIVEICKVVIKVTTHLMVMV